VRLESKLERNYQLLGWALFIISAIGFIASSIRSGDILGLIGGVFFLLACFAFLVPFFRPDASGSLPGAPHVPCQAEFLDDPQL
jgi:hypothetical protein